jgi:hypothetical protein
VAPYSGDAFKTALLGRQTANLHNVTAART